MVGCVCSSGALAMRVSDWGGWVVIWRERVWNGGFNDRRTLLEAAVFAGFMAWLILFEKRSPSSPDRRRRVVARGAVALHERK